ncbi:MAG: hypothetical protein AAF517_03935, partial [Planctomycetota bacterium]
LAIWGLIFAFLIILFCASSTPMIGVGMLIVGTYLIRWREKLGLLRWSIVVGLFVLHFFVMEKPVWHLIGRIDLAGGSTGYHRYRLINACILRWREWWAIGCPSTGHWGYGLHDITCEYVLTAVRGGLLALILHVSILWVAFKNVGQAWRKVEDDPAMFARVWAVGLCLLIHASMFMAVSYFGQNFIVYYLHIALAGSLSASLGKDQLFAPKEKQESDEEDSLPQLVTQREPARVRPVY